MKIQKLKNCKIAFIVNNSKYVTVTENNLLFDIPGNSAFNAIAIAGINSSGFSKMVGNTIKSQAAQPAGSFAIATSGADFNSSPINEIDDSNTLRNGSPNSARLAW